MKKLISRFIFILILGFLIIPFLAKAELKEYGPFDSPGDISISKDVWGLEYEKGGQHYVIINGKLLGPYEKTYNYYLSTINDKWGFIYDKGKVNINGSIFGPYEYPGNLKLTREGYGFSRNTGTFTTVNINGKDYGPYSKASYDISDSSWGYLYDKEGGSYFNINGKEYGPYWQCYKIFVKDNNWAATYRIDKNNYINIKDQVFGPYESIEDVSISNKNWGFKFVKDRKYFVNYNNKIFGPYELVSDLMVTDKNWGFTGTTEITSRAVINGEEKTAYDGAGYLAIAEDNWAFWYSKNNQHYVNVKGSYYGPYSERFYIAITNNAWAFGYKKNEKFFYNINGMEYGPFDRIASSKPAINEEKSGFFYNKSGKWYANILDINNLQKSTEESVGKSTTKLNPPKNLIGRILLRVEDSGKAYYINPKKNSVHYLGKPTDAFNVMREQGVGATNIDIEKIPVGLIAVSGKDTDGDGLSDIMEDALGINKNLKDTDGDGFDDKTEIAKGYDPKIKKIKAKQDLSFANNKKGMIFLQVQNKGEAWYVNPQDGKRYFLGRADDAFQVMKKLGLGISNNDFNLYF